MEPKETKPKKEKPKERYEVYHQPEILGIYDNETDKLLVLHQEENLEKEFGGQATIEAIKLNRLDKITKSVVG